MQKTQYTFRIIGSYRQLIENAHSEKAARKQLAIRLLEEEHTPLTEEAIQETATSRLRLVQTR